MDYVYIAGPLFDDHERSYLESIAKIFEDRGHKTFLPHRDAGVVKDKYTQDAKGQIFTTDIEALDKATIVVALLTGSCLLYTSPSPRDPKTSRMPSSA